MERIKFNRATVMRLIAHYFLALMLASLLGTLVQSQVNLMAIASLIGGISWTDWLATCWFDLLHFTPTLAAILVPTLAVAFFVAALLLRVYSRSAYLVYFVVTLMVLYGVLLVINHVAPMPTLIAANRTWAGTLGLLLSGGIGASLFAYLQTERIKKVEQEN